MKQEEKNMKCNCSNKPNNNNRSYSWSLYFVVDSGIVGNIIHAWITINCVEKQWAKAWQCNKLRSATSFQSHHLTHWLFFNEDQWRRRLTKEISGVKRNEKKEKEKCRTCNKSFIHAFRDERLPATVFILMIMLLCFIIL